MTDFTSVAIPKPKDWQALERHGRLLFQLSLGDPAVQNNGRTGQPQHGVDIFGRRNGGTGRRVGVQCKGKDADYGEEVTEKELRAEVRKTEKFVPPIDEFILITTAPNDQKIQRAARLLEEELRMGGRNLVIQVWGWERVQQEINRFPEVIKAFHPDSTPFTDKLFDEAAELKSLMLEGHAELSGKLSDIRRALAQVLNPKIAVDGSVHAEALDRELHDQIDGYRDLLRGNRPRTALDLLTRLKDRLGSGAPQRVRYRLLSNIGVAHYNLGEHETAADFLLEAASLNPDDAVSLANKAAALLIKGRKEEAHAVVVEAIAKHPESQEIALQRMQAVGPGETIESIWDSLSQRAKDSAIVHALRLGAMRGAEDPGWLDLIDEACRRFPDDGGLKIIRAEGVIDRLLRNDPGAVGLVTAAVPTQRELWDAAELLEKTWVIQEEMKLP